MNSPLPHMHVREWLTAASALVIAAATGTAASLQDESQGAHHMTLHSATFQSGGTLPLSMIGNIPNAGGQNTCTADGSPGGNESPQLTWTNAPEGTRSFAVIAYDVTAQFTHWAMYNIPLETTSLPENAGLPGSNYGVQNGNDFFDPGYDGPCPQTIFTPFTHQYTFTVYALDTSLRVVPTFGDFVPAGPEGLYQELIAASRDGHVLASATITGHYSAAAAKN